MNDTTFEIFLNKTTKRRILGSDFITNSYFFNDSFENFKLPYYGDYLREYRDKYASLHGYISLVVCVFGIIVNILNIVILTRKNMASSTNVLLTWLAAADTTVMLFYIPLAFHDYVLQDLAVQEKFSYGWAVFVLLHMHFTLINHNISTWLTVTLALWRFIAVCYPFKAVILCSMSKARCVVLSTYIACTILWIPQYLTFAVTMSEGIGYIAYHVEFSDISQKHEKLLERIQFWLFSVISKLAPCFLMTGLSICLIRALHKMNIRRKSLTFTPESHLVEDRITKMLLIVLLLFLITELPNGVLALMSGILGTDFFLNVYVNFLETMDVLALVNSAINFIIYFSMNRQFRATFRFLFVPKILIKNDNVHGSQQTEHTAL